MVNNSLSVRLADSCCNYNYLKRVLGKGSVVMYGRKYHWEEVKGEPSFSLFCNNRIIGCLYIDTIYIYSETVSYCPRKSYLEALIALFNLYPY